MAGSNFVDYVKIFARSGHGGAGSAHFRREKFVAFGGPDGGDGGKGGSIVLQGDRQYWTLIHLKYQRHQFAEDGQCGSGARSSGKDAPNIVWMIGGDIRGDIKTEVWEALARTIRGIDPHHLMTFHPYGRTSSVEWFHQADWLDFNMFQSGHRRYDQIRGDGDDRAEASMTEDNWRYVEAGLCMRPAKPILDGEPSYEGIPQGLHDPEEPWWKASDVRRYAYWSVFAGALKSGDVHS